MLHALIKILLQCLLTRIVQLTVELLSIASLEHNLLLDHVLNGPLHHRVLRRICSIVDLGRIFISQQKLGLHMLREEGSLLLTQLATSSTIDPVLLD